MLIGLDFGTQSARGVLVSAKEGEVLLSHTVRYARGVLPGDLACAADYEDALLALLAALTPEKYRAELKGICADATSMSMVPLARDGRALSALPGLEDNPHAQIKLWKRHSAQKQAGEALALAKARGEPFLGRTGGTISSEWLLPKLLETLDEAPGVYAEIDRAMDLCEFLTYCLTGNPARTVGVLGYKCLWAGDLGFPSRDYLDALRPGLGLDYPHFLRGDIGRPGDRAGYLKASICERLGLRPGIAVATGLLDGHTALAALGSLRAGDAALVLGTSNVLTIQSARLREVSGICGIALDGLIGGLYGIDAGQSCTGDMLGWYMENMLPRAYAEEAAARGIDAHALLAGKIERPWENPVAAVDWWNGSRNAPCDLALRGELAGLSLETRPEQIYLALLQAIACGTRGIIEHCEEAGVPVRRLLAAGGVASKNPLLMREYANLLNRPVEVGRIAEGPALGSALFAAVAAGIYPDIHSAYARMGVKERLRYAPDTEHSAQYARIYENNRALRETIIQREAQRGNTSEVGKWRQ